MKQLFVLFVSISILLLAGCASTSPSPTYAQFDCSKPGAHRTNEAYCDE